MAALKKQIQPVPYHLKLILLTLVVATTVLSLVAGSTSKSYALTGAECIACHDGNGPWAPPLLNKYGNPDPRYTPHFEGDGNMKNEHHYYPMIMGSRSCSSCHSYRKVLDYQNNDLGRMFGVCVNCHYPGNTIFNAKTPDGAHEPVHDMTDVPQAMCRGCHDGNVYDEHSGRTGFIDAEGDLNCATCHSSADQNVLDQIALGSTPNNQMIYCADCHADIEAIHHSMADTSVGNCEYCHADPRPDPSWTGAFPGDNGTNSASNVPTQMACRGCHVEFIGGTIEVSKFTRTNYVEYTEDYTKEVIHTVPTSLGQINNYGMCLSCHTNNANPDLNITVFHARPDKHDPVTWYMFNGEIYLGDGGRCTGTIGLNPDAPIAYGYARYTPGRSTGTIGAFNLHKVPGFGYDPGPSDAEACSDEGNYDSSPWNFTLLSVPAQLTGGPANVPVFSSLLRRTSGGVIGAPSPGTYTHTYQYTGGIQTLTLPDIAINIQFTLKGGGGGGGRPENLETQTAGQPGSMVTAVYTDTVSIGTTNLKIYVAGGGTKGSTTYLGAPGGFGYTAGRNGFDGDSWGGWEYAPGGAGGGGASAIVMNENNSVILARARGGQGGNSSDWEHPTLGDFFAGGLGGWGGGTNIYPGGTQNITGGGCGGNTAPLEDGCNGEVVITYDIP